MAGLNDDVEEGLISLEEDTDLTIVEDVFTNQTNPSQPDPNKIVFTTKDVADSIEETPISINELFGDSLVPGELPNLNAEFELIEQKRNTINDYEETSNLITGRNSISQEDAKILDSIVPGFINDDRPLEYFTKNNTRTYFNESITVMKNVIEKENDIFNEMIKNHLNNLLQHYSTFNTGFEVKIKDILLNQNKTIKNLLENEVIFSTDITDKFFKQNIVLNDLLSVPVDELIISDIASDDSFFNLLTEIKTTFNNNSLKNYLNSFSIKNNGSLTSILLKENCLNSSFSLNDYFNLQKSNKLETLSFDILEKTRLNENTLNVIRNNFINDERRSGNLNSKTVSLPDIILLTKDFNYINSLSKSLYLLNILIIKFLELFKH